MKFIFTLLPFLFALSCSQNPQSAAPESSQPQVQTQAEEKGHQAGEWSSAALNGSYVFDAERYKEAQLSSENSMFKKMNAEDLERLLSVFRPFRVDVEGDVATATFAQDVIKGKLVPLGKETDDAAQSRFVMRPLDEDKQEQTATITFEGDSLVLDPGKKETDRMYFRRVEMEYD